jgi:hypothetical protein
MIVDIMPTDEASLGFSNRWYQAAYQHAVPTDIGEMVIRVVTGPYFLATKLEAFLGRGNGDFMASHDMEDIAAIVDGRAELVGEIAQGPEDLKLYLAEMFQGMLSNERFVESLPGHLPGDSASQQRFPILEERIREISRIA